MSRDHDHDQEPEEPEKGIAWGNVVLAGAGILAGIGLAAAGRKAHQRWTRGAYSSDMADRVMSAARHLGTPTPPRDYVGPGDERWDDQICGGLIGPGHWQYYQDGYGTTCAVFACAVLAAAGVDVWTSPLTGASGRLLLNYDPPRGVGFVVGKWAERFVDGGRKCGIYRTDPDLKPGDLYCIVRDNNPAKWHVGIVLERDGERVLTADGGQSGPPTATAPKGCQCARLTRRTLRGKTLASPNAGPGIVQYRLTWEG